MIASLIPGICLEIFCESSRNHVSHPQSLTGPSDAPVDILIFDPFSGSKKTWSLLSVASRFRLSDQNGLLQGTADVE